MSGLNPTREQLAQMMNLGAATLFHGQGEVGAVDSDIKAIAPGMKLAGPALTVDVPAGDNLALHLAISKAESGAVLVVDYKAYLDVAVTGDIMAHASMIRGIAGMAIDGGARDADEIAAMGFPIFARGLSIRGPTKSEAGTIGEPITFGGVEVKSGDIIVGDTDGLVVIEESRWQETLAAAAAREEKETSIRTQLSEGNTTVDLLDLLDLLDLGEALERNRMV